MNGFGIPTDVNSGVFGGRLSYFPTRYWSIVAQVDQTLGMSTSLAPSFRREFLPGRSLLSCSRLMESHGIGRSASAAATREANSLDLANLIIMAGWPVLHSIMKYGGICC